MVHDNFKNDMILIRILITCLAKNNLIDPTSTKHTKCFRYPKAPSTTYIGIVDVI